MKVTTALLCDFAQVREGLLFVSSGGITRAWRPNLPAPLNVFLALVCEFDRMELGRLHELQVRIVGEDGESVADVTGGFQPESPPDLRHGEKFAVPFTLDLRPAPINQYGAYDVKIVIDGEWRHDLSLRVEAPPETAPAPPEDA